jgi:Concanavalin A-like lectin/glucanases superfamily/Immunoglobulin I-set domain
MKSTLIPIGLTCACISLARADFTPIPLDPTSFNQDPVIEKTAPRSVNDYVTVTPDAGTNKTGNAWFEQGYNTTNTAMGLPPHNSLVLHTNSFTSVVYTFQMPPDYHVNNCVFVGHCSGSATPILGPATLNLVTPKPFNTISVLNGSGNGACTIKYTVHFANGNTESGTFSSTDWWSGNADSALATRVWDAAGLVGMGGGVNNTSANHGVIWANDLPLSDTTDNVTSIDFQWIVGSSNGSSPWGNGRTVIFGLAGSADGQTFSPVAVSGYTQDAVVEADASKTVGSGPESLTGFLTNGNTYCSVTMDGAYAKTGSTWYEQGYYAAFPQSGIPAAGSSIASAARPFIHYTMPSTYVGNCGYYLSVAVSNATVKFATPTAASSLAFLAGGGNGGIWIRVELGFQGGGAETNWIFAPDWFTRDTQPAAFTCFGRVAPSVIAFNNTPDQFGNAFLPVDSIGGVYIGGLAGAQPFSRDPRNGAGPNPGGGANFNIPGVRLFDAIMPISNSGSAISTMNLVITNTSGGNDATIFAVSGSPGTPPVITTQPTGLVTANSGTPIVTNNAALQNTVILTKCYQGTNNVWLMTSNSLSSGVTYQWKKAPRGGGFRDLYDTFDMSTFVNVSAPNIGGATSPVLVISNATLADSGDYLVVCANQFGSQTSFVATVQVMSTNYSLLVGTGSGDQITLYSADGTSGNGEDVTHAIDQVAQKWLSTGLGGVGLDGNAVAKATVPWVGPVGYVVTPVSGASFVNAIRFYCANDGQGRDPRDYLLEGSNDGSTWTTISGGQMLGTTMLPTQRGGTGSAAIDPMASPLTEIDFANSTSYKSYRVTITNCMEPINTPLMQLAEVQLIGTFVPAPPTWVLEPVSSVIAYVGTSPTFAASATGIGAQAPTYQWYRSPSTLIAGATGSSYTITNVQTSANGTSYYCVAQNKSGQITSTSGSLTVVAAPTQSYPSAVLADKPMSYWRLDEPDDGSGNEGALCHDYAGGHNGSYSNVVLNVPGYNPASDPDTAAQFGGNFTQDSFVDNINGVDFARASGNATFSVEAWAYGATPATGTPAIITKGYDGNLSVGTKTGTEQYVIDLQAAGFRFLVRDSTGQGYVAQSSIQATDPVTGNAAWHHLVGVCDQPNGKLYIYVDGLLAGSGTIVTNTGIESQKLPTTIGARKSTDTAEYDEQWSGVIDDVAVYPYALTASQVLNHVEAAQRAPLFSKQPQDINGVTNITIANNLPETFYSSAYGPGTVTYQWWNSDGTEPTTIVPGATSSNYVFTTSPSQANVSYQVVASSQYGSSTSSPIMLNVLSGAPAFIVDLPVSQTIYLGHIIQLHVVAGGTAPFTYQWQKNGANINNDYRTSGAQTDTLTIGYAQSSDTATYSVIVTGQGSTTSTLDAITVVTNSGSFFNAGSGAGAWTLSGVAAITGNTLSLTTGAGSQSGSGWLTTKQNIASFHVAFFYQDVSGSGGADGITFCIQNYAVNALIGGGGSLGYDGITPSVALAMNIYSPNTMGIAFAQNGVRGTPYISLLPNVDIGGNTNVIQINADYDGTTLAFTFKDTVTGGTAVTNWTVNIPTVVGASTAWVGFTGADGGVASSQNVFWGNAAPTPIRMNVSKAGNNLVLSWPANIGAYLMASPSLGSTAVWTQSTAPFELIGSVNSGTVQVTVTPGPGASFFRLEQLP